MSLAQEHPELHDSVDILVERFGPEDAEMRLLAALSLVRQRKVKEARS